LSFILGEKTDSSPWFFGLANFTYRVIVTPLPLTYCDCENMADCSHITHCSSISARLSLIVCEFVTAFSDQGWSDIGKQGITKLSFPPA